MRLLALIGLVGVLVLPSCAGKKHVVPVQERETVERVITHRVESGETWQSLSRDFYGDEESAGKIARDNGMDAEEAPRTGSAVRISLGERDVKRMKNRLDAARNYNEGLDLASRQNYAAAIAKFEEAAKLDPSFSEASFNLAVSYEKLGFHTKALAILRPLVSLSPGNVEFRYALGASLFGEGDLAGAEKAFREVLAKEPADRKSLYSLAVVLEKRGAVEEAVSRFREYLALDPEGEWTEAARGRLEALLRAGGDAR